MNGTTNLPDESLVTVLVGRQVTFQGEEPRLFPVANGGVRVADGRFALDAVITDGQLINTLLEEVRAVRAGARPAFGPLEAIATDLTVCAQLRPSDSDDKPVQSEPVMEAIGGVRGKNLVGSPDAKAFGDATWLEAITVAPLATTKLAEIERLAGRRVRSTRTTDPFCAA